MLETVSTSVFYIGRQRQFVVFSSILKQKSAQKNGKKYCKGPLKGGSYAVIFDFNPFLGLLRALERGLSRRHY